MDPARLHLSMFVDALVIYMSLGAALAWPPPHYAGIVRDVVTLASRLESATKELGVDVWTSLDALRRRGRGRRRPADARPRRRHRLRGREQPIDVVTFAD